MAKIVETSEESKGRVGLIIKLFKELLNYKPEFNVENTTLSQDAFTYQYGDSDEKHQAPVLSQWFIGNFLYKEDSRGFFGRLEALRHALYGVDTGEQIVDKLEAADKITELAWSLDDDIAELESAILEPEKKFSHIKDSVKRQQARENFIKCKMKEIKETSREIYRQGRKNSDIDNALYRGKLADKINDESTDKRNWE